MRQRPERNSPEYRKRHRDYVRERYEANAVYRERQKAAARQVNARFRARVDAAVAVFRSEGCAYCGEMDACCLVAHHLDPTKKDFNIGQAKRLFVTLPELKRELRKCVCLCANCHAKVHAGRITLEN